MLDYMKFGVMPDKNHTWLRRESDQLLYQEHCFTRAGFSRTYSILYHRVAPTRLLGTGPSQYDGTDFVAHEEPNSALNYPLRRRHINTNNAQQGENIHSARKCIMFNEDIHVSLSRPMKNTAEFFANGDGDELFFFFKGCGWCETMFGRIDFKAYDYLLIPRGCIYRFHFEFDKGEVFAMIFEGRANIEIPESFRNAEGQLLLEAPYCHRDFGKPSGLMTQPDEQLPRGENGNKWTVITKRFDRIAEHHYGHYPCDAAGWDGFVYPITLPILNYQPKAGLVHLPPTSHLTFASWETGGEHRYVICSFVPRMVDFHERAIPCPYNHSSPNADEILFYVEGNFISRKGIGPGSISIHPTGMPHGPHPGSYEASIGHRKTGELAVMCDTFAPLRLTNYGATLEVPGYNESWIDCKVDGGKEKEQSGESDNPTKE